MTHVICVVLMLKQTSQSCASVEAKAAVSYSWSAAERVRAVWAVFPNMSSFIALPSGYVCTDNCQLSSRGSEEICCSVSVLQQTPSRNDLKSSRSSHHRWLP